MGLGGKILAVMAGKSSGRKWYWSKLQLWRRIPSVRKQERGSKCQGPEGRTKNKPEVILVARKKADAAGPQGTRTGKNCRGKPILRAQRPGKVFFIVVLFCFVLLSLWQACNTDPLRPTSLVPPSSSAATNITQLLGPVGQSLKRFAISAERPQHAASTASSFTFGIRYV